MILKNKTELSTIVITHKLKIKWEWTKYISEKMAESIFKQFKDQKTKIITIVNEENFSFITKYKSEIDLIKLNSESRDFEDTLFLSWLSEERKETIRDIWGIRQKERKSRTNTVLQNIIKSFN